MRLKRFWPGVLLLVFLANTLTSARAEWNAGAGMEYFTFKTLVDDQDGRYFHTVLQSTLAVAKFGYSSNAWEIMCTGGLTNWNVDGEWQGTIQPRLSTEPFGWSWQQQYAFKGRYTFWDSLGLGLRYTNHEVMHYDGLTEFKYLHYRLRWLDLMLSYQPLQTGDLAIELSLAYAPLAELEFFNSLPRYADNSILFTFDGHGPGTRLQGQVEFKYRDSAGWGLDVAYTWSRAHFTDVGELSRVMLTSGRLTGYFIFHF